MTNPATEGTAQAAPLVELPDTAQITVVTSAHPGGQPDSAQIIGVCPYTPAGGPDRQRSREALTAAGWSLTGPWADAAAGIYTAPVRRDPPHP